MEKNMDRVRNTIQMGISMKEIGKRINEKEKEFISITMEISMKEIGKKIKKMVLVLSFIQMEILNKVYIFLY